MMLGFLLARAGVEVLVLEKHADFLRDFRGDTIHPSTLQVMHELGLLAEFLKRPHQQQRRLNAHVAGTELTIADFSHVPGCCQFIAFMPQWDFLNFIAEQAARYSRFQLRMQAEVIDLIVEDERVVGVRANTPDGPLDVRADLIVAADGRHSTVRQKSGLQSLKVGVPIDVLWMRVSRRPADPEQSLGRVAAGKILVMLNRDEYWQCAFVIAKGGLGQIQQRGLPAFREDIANIAPFLRDRVAELHDWSDIKLLTVEVDRLKRWSRPGLLCIGDAAHAMSPIGGVGINLAIQDAVAASNLLAAALLRGAPTMRDLEKVQRRRELPVRLTQKLQVLIQDRAITRILGTTKPLSFPWPLKLFRRWPLLRRIPARLIGIGFRPEHVKTRESVPVQ